MGYMDWAWLGVAIVCVVIEALTMGLTTIWFAIGAVVAWFVYMAGFGLYAQVIVFLAVSIVCLIFTRPVAVKNLKVGKTRTNADSLIGQRAVVISPIDNLNGKGNVKIRGQEWSARSADESESIEEGETVVVKEIKGVKLIVEKIKKED